MSDAIDNFVDVSQPKRKRRVVQVATISDSASNYPCIVALCDDGTIWTVRLGHREWTREPSIPDAEDGQ